MASPFNTDKKGYLTFNGVTLTELINSSLRDNSVFTEQDLTGSNLAAIHQTLGYVMSVAMLYVNEQSAENKYVDSNVYKNMSRIVKELGYNPIGAQTSTLTFNLSAQLLSKGFYTIPRYSFIDIGGIKYSFNEDVTFAKTVDTAVEALSSISREKLLYQGQFIEHATLTATGVANELQYLSVDDQTLIDHFNIHVYVKETQTQTWNRWNATETLYSARSQDRLYTLRLNANKRYELQFGDDINGRALKQGDQIAIYYLRTDGSRGEVGVGAIDRRSMVAFDTMRLRAIITDTEQTSFSRLTTSLMRNSLIFANVVGSTYFALGDTVEDMRRKAPNTFRSQFRLVHEDDYAAFAETNYANIIHSVVAFNNAQYIDGYMKYYHDLGLTKPSDISRPLLNQLQFGTSCNFNNIYLCIVPKTANSTIRQTLYLSSASKSSIKQAMNRVKTATSEIMFVDPVYVACDFGVPANNTINSADIAQSKLVIVQHAKSIKSPSLLQRQVADIITETLALTNQQLGQAIDINKLTGEIMAVDGVQSIYTLNTTTNTRVQGISMYTWDPLYPAASLSNTSTTIQLSAFQIAFLDNASTIVDRINVERESRAYTTFDV